jgi:hypothetical protein
VQGGERLEEQGDRRPPEYEEGDDIDLDDIIRTYQLTAVGKCDEFIALPYSVGFLTKIKVSL